MNRGVVKTQIRRCDRVEDYIERIIDKCELTAYDNIQFSDEYYAAMKVSDALKMALKHNEDLRTTLERKLQTHKV